MDFNSFEETSEFNDSSPKYDGWCSYMWAIPFLTSSYCWTLSTLNSLFENSILALHFAKHYIEFSTFCSLSHQNLVLAVTVLLLLVLLLAKPIITYSLVSEAMFIYEKIFMRTHKLFWTPSWSFSLAFENWAGNSSPGVNSALGFFLFVCLIYLMSVW